MSKKGNVNILVIYIFIVISTLCFLVININAFKVKSLYNLKKSHEFLNQEIVIINYLKCSLLNDNLKEGNISFNNLNFSVSLNEEEIIVNVNSKYRETITVILSGNKIIDYKTSTDIEVDF